MKFYYGYGRVSTARQAEKVSLHVQEQTLKKHAEDLGLPFQFYSEGVSGKDIEGRIEFNKVYEKLKKGDVLGVYDEFRLGRNTRESLRIFDELTERGVQLQIKGKILDPDDPVDELLLTFMSGIGAYQRKYQNLRVKEAIKYVKQKGNWIFTGRLYGYDQSYDKNGNTKISINEKEAEIL